MISGALTIGIGTYSVNFAANAGEGNSEELDIPTVSEVLLNGYPQNDNGETYGPNIKDWDYEPDLILAEDENGKLGYVNSSDMFF